jgi:hypothetical protein
MVWETAVGDQGCPGGLRQGEGEETAQGGQQETGVCFFGSSGISGGNFIERKQR